MERKKILITGVCGFIGSNLLFKLVDKNDIVGVDNFEYSDKEKCKEFVKDIMFYEGDISDKKTFDKLPKDFDYIFHFGSPSSIILFEKNPSHCYIETVLGCMNILEFAKEIGVKKAIFPSSGSVYAGNSLPHSETVIPYPKNSYAASKIACEAMINSFSDFVDSVILRIFAGYGPGEERKNDFASVVYLFLNSIMKEINPIVFGNGMQSRDFIYIDDIISSIINAAESDYKGVINVGSGKATTFNDLIKIINETLNKNIQPKYIPKEKNYVDMLEADTRLMKKILKIDPIPLEVGIKKFAEYLEVNYSQLTQGASPTVSSQRQRTPARNPFTETSIPEASLTKKYMVERNI